jgi:hypothetical protein
MCVRGGVGLSKLLLNATACTAAVSGDWHAAADALLLSTPRAHEPFVVCTPKGPAGAFCPMERLKK